MKARMSVMVLLNLAGQALSAPPAHWPEVATNTYLIPASVERFGNTLHFATGSPSHLGSWAFGWRWVHCQKPWISDMTGLGFSQAGMTGQDAYSQVAAKPDNFFKAAIEFLPIASPPFGDGTALRRQLSTRCKTETQSQSAVELPIAHQREKLARKGSRTTSFCEPLNDAVT